MPVGSRPRGATPKGLLDMAGSLLERTHSTLDRPYPYRADDAREDSERAGGERVVRGGNYISDASTEKAGRLEPDRLVSQPGHGPPTDRVSLRRGLILPPP